MDVILRVALPPCRPIQALAVTLAVALQVVGCGAGGSSPGVDGTAADPNASPPGRSVPEAQTTRGDLSVSFRANGASPRGLSGIDSLFNTRHAPDFDAFDPTSPAASAGVNFEHILSGHRSPHNGFTPRRGPYTLHDPGDGRTFSLVRRAEDSPWKVDSRLTYVVREPHYVDFEFRCTPRDASLFGAHGYAVFFFASYMNDVADVALHFRGRESEGAPESWVAADAPPGPPDWNEGGTYRGLEAKELSLDDDVEFRLNTWSYDWPRITEPFFYGRAEKGMTLILMFDRLVTERDQIRFSLFKFKLPRHPRPAWDFQYVVDRVTDGEEYGFRGRLVWKRFESPEDCRQEYLRWAAETPRGGTT